MSWMNDWFGAMMAASDTRKLRKELRNIDRANLANQGIVRYRPSQIENFFDLGEPLGSMVFSGGAAYIRNRAVVRAAECALSQGQAVLVLHCGNRELERSLEQYFGGSVCLVNRSNPVYDPFLGASTDNITRLTMAAAGGRGIGNAGRYYLNGMTDFARAKGVAPYGRMYLNCPHLTLIDNVNNCEASGRITGAQARQILSELMQGETERGNVESFFSTLSAQADGIIARKNEPYAVNVAWAVKNGLALAVDVQSAANVQLVCLLIEEAQLQAASGGRMTVVLDGLPVMAAEGLKNAVSTGGNNSFILSSDDAYADFGGDDNLFFAFMGRCTKLVVSRHNSAYTCQKFADTFGSYDKQEISSTYAKNVNYLGRYGLGASQTANVSVKRENVVKAEEIQRMATDEVYILDKATGELANVQVI